ncbi:MAG: cell wall metabolism sensor histidine kinase WalK [Clostridiales bacterium]|nr:cell wall metabolism sensor histidine kinase WalK [Clostridiales bacterium]
MLRRLDSLRWKLLVSYLLIGLIPLFFFAFSILSTMAAYFSDNKKQELLNQAGSLSTSISVAHYLTDETKRPMFDFELQEKAKAGNFRIMVFDSKSYVVNDSNVSESEAGKTIAIPEVNKALDKLSVAELLPDKEVIHAAVYISDETGNVTGAVLIISSVSEIGALLSTVTERLLQFGCFIGVVTAILVFFISQLIIDPLKRLVKVVQKMSEGHLNERIGIRGNDEFAELSGAFNDMTDQLEKVETTRQEFVSNVSHELKTPLSSMKVLGESLLLQEEAPPEMYREFLRDIISEVDRMTNIINELLSLVKLDQTEQALNIRQVKVNKLIEDILKRLYPIAEQRGIELLYEDVRTVVVDADEMKVSLAISNLVENGIKYSEDGGTVKVIVDADHQNAFITVQDNGIGINDEDQTKVFNRFYRVDKTRDRKTGGTGLGLAITHKTVLLHHGSIKLMSKENEGSTFVVRLPIHQY